MYILKELYIQQKDIVGYSGDNFGNIILTKTSYKNLSKILEDKYSIIVNYQTFGIYVSNHLS